MSSTLSHSGTSHSHLNHKAVKRPDGFFVALKKFFDSLGQHTTGLIFVIGVLVAVSALGVFLMTRHDAKEESARSSFFLAEKSLEETYKTLAAQAAPAKESKDAAAKESKEAKDAKKKEAENLEALLYKKMNVDAQFAAPLALLKSVSTEHSGTRGAQEATLEIGNLYLNHGEPAKATEWFQKALSNAPTAFEKAAAGSGVGHSYEDAGNYPEAAKAYESAAKADSPLKGELLLSLARVYELQKDSAKARSTYDQIISQMPMTETSKIAESQKALLE